MDGRHTPRSLAPPGALAAVRTWLGLGVDPPLPRPLAPRLPRLHRVGLLAAWQARAAVAASIPLADFLRARLARYDARLPLPRARLPIAVELGAAGEIRAVALEEPMPPTPTGDPAGLSALVALEGPAAARRWTEAERALEALEALETFARKRVEELALRFSADVARGALAETPDPAAPGAGLGRPRVRSPLLLVALSAAAGAATLAEAWAIAVPMLQAAGSYPPRLELGPGALPLALLAGFALGAAVGLLALASATAETFAAPARGAPRSLRRRLAIGGLLAGLLSAAAVAAASAIPATQPGLPPARGVVLLLALPAGAALALRAARREARLRAADLQALLAWDRTRTATLSERARRAEEVDWAEDALRTAAARTQRARRRLAALRGRAETAARRLSRAAGRERAARYRLALSLVGALERDRYAYLRQAAAHGANELVPGAAAARGRTAEPPPRAGDAPGPGRVAV